MTTNRSPRRLLPTALAVAAVAVLSGTTGAVAAGQITGSQIKDGSITSADLQNGTVTGVDVARYTLGPSDTSANLDRYLQRVGGYKIVQKAGTFASGAAGSVQATCPNGTRVLGAGAYWNNSYDGPQVIIAFDGRSAQAFGSNSSGDQDAMVLRVTCGRVVS